MTNSPQFRVRLVGWREASATLTRIRTTVFVVEQNVPAGLEMDGRDGDCAHALAETADGEPIGTGRLMPDGRIGRMAVLASWRGRGVGAAILDALMAEAKRRGFRETYLHAQSHAQAFYARHGYVVEGDEYLEAGIPHIGMRATL
ncbi:MAG TPA: GNAT family N-acetyltransferase [Usitatibacteraceae bacterium]|nr:GNAT family N-acetyltransferase [Usitatibacteraceae bacterium]